MVAFVFFLAFDERHKDILDHRAALWYYPIVRQTVPH